MADTLRDQLTADMKDAMRAKDKERLGTIRLILAAVKQREVDERIELDDTQVLAVLDKMMKQRRDSIKQYSDAAEGMKDMGKVMGQLKPKLQGRADMGKVSGKIKARLSA
jgi:uncharacterized protein YqeY